MGAIDRSSDVDVCNALMVCVEAELPATVRAQVLGTLWTLAASSLTDAEKLWHNRSVRKGLEKCARIGEHVDVRTTAFEVLANLARHTDNQVAMWKTDTLSRTLVRTISTGGPLRTTALAVVVELTTCFNNLAAMVRVGVHTILAAAAEDDGIGEADRIPLCAARDRLLWYMSEWLRE